MNNTRTRARQGSSSGGNTTSTHNQVETVKVSTPEIAYSLFREFLKSSPQHINMEGSRAKYYTIEQMVEYFVTVGKKVDKGWLGRALTNAANSGKFNVSYVEASKSNGSKINVYRNSR